VGFLRKQRGVPFVRRAPTEGGDDVPIHVANVRARFLYLSERSSKVRLVAMLGQCLLE
jgi:hypothetical protein